MLGLSLIDPKNPMIGLADKAFKHIKKQLKKNADLEKMTSEELAGCLNCFENDAQIALGHIARLPNTCGPSCGLPGDKFGCREIGFGDGARLIYAYFKHDSIHGLIEESYLNFMKHSKSSGTGEAFAGIAVPVQLPSEKSVYIDPARIDELKAITSEEFDLSKLIRLCEEVNAVYASSSYYSVVMLLRTIIDHVPLIFGKDNFSQVASEIKGSTNQRVFKRLDKSLKDQANTYLHGSVRKKESPPNKTAINFSSELDTLLVEIIHELH